MKIRRKIGGYLASIKFIKQAIDEKADISAFREKPSGKIIFGIFLIILSYLMAWPTISVLGAVSIYYKDPFIVGVAGPILYGISYLVFFAGIYLSGAEYSKIFLRWSARRLTEKLLE